MRAAEKYIDSAPLLGDEDYLTVTSDKEEGVGEITEHRIKSFLEEPSIESDDEENFVGNIIGEGTSSISVPVDKEPIALAPKSVYRPIIFNAIQSWEGYVIDIFKYYFTARLTDLDEQEQDEDVEILLKDVSEDDKKLVEPGAIFYWHVGFENERGTIKRSSIIRFRRMPRWTDSAFKKAKITEDKIKKILAGDE